MFGTPFNHTTETLMIPRCRRFPARPAGAPAYVIATFALALVVPVLVNATTPIRTEDGKIFPMEDTMTFGDAVAVYGDTMVVGDQYNDRDGNEAGAAWVFVRSGDTWVEDTRLIPSQFSLFGHFGSAVDIYDDYIVVGAKGDIGADDISSGAAYVFRRFNGNWIQDAKLIGDTVVIDDPWDHPGSYDHFGASVAINGDIPAESASNDIWLNILVGSPGDNHSQSSKAGSAYLFQLSPDGTDWGAGGKAYSHSPEPWDHFGASVDLDGDHMIIGAPDAGGGGSLLDSGMAFILVRRGILGLWAMEALLTAPEPESHEHFGKAVAVHSFGGIAAFAVGTPRDDDLATDSGAVYVFVGSAATFPLFQKLTASDGAFSDQFGTSIAISDSGIVVGAPKGVTVPGGSLYVFTREGISWTESEQLKVNSPTPWETLGYSVAISGTTALAGAPKADGTGYRTGAVYLFNDLDLEIFSDGFNNGGTGRWSATVP